MALSANSHPAHLSSAAGSIGQSLLRAQNHEERRTENGSAGSPSPSCARGTGYGRELTMRIVHLLRKYNPEEWGGTETALLRLLDGLRPHGVTPIIYAPKNGIDSQRDPLAR